ncbi:MAG: hypothetical protein ACRBBT_00715 [Paracoccaceae bacterium]
MGQELKDHAIAFFVSILLGAAVFVITASLGTANAESVALGVVAGLGTHLIFDRVAYRRKLDATKKEIIETLRVGAPFEAGYTIYSSEKDAVRYVNSVLQNAVSVWNTRLGTLDSPSSRTFKTMIDEHDKQILGVLQRGGDVRIIHEVLASTNQADDFMKAAGRILETDGAGTFELYAVDYALAPVQQMIIIEFSDGSSEALVGWAVGEEKSFNYKVCLFRDRPIVNYFRTVFEEYTLYRKT